MKKGFTLIIVILLLLSLAACGIKKDIGYEIPDVFGIHYTDAVGILEAAGFEVSAVETGVDSFSDKLLYPLKAVDKGTVFKINDYIIDGNGHLNENYDVWYDGGLVCSDKRVIIYYAKEDFVTDDNTIPTEPSTGPSVEATTPSATEGEDNGEDDTIDPQFKAAMDSYEKFFDEYVAIMKKYNEDPTDMSILDDYIAYMGQYADVMQELEQWGKEDLNATELAYYMDVQARISKKLLEVA